MSASTYGLDCWFLFFQSYAFLPFTDTERKQIHYELREIEDIPYSTSKRKRETYTRYIWENIDLYSVYGLSAS